jgi:DNA-binding response OmpR family regulator
MNAPKHILVVEHDPHGRDLLLESLAGPRLRVTAVSTASEALEVAAREKPDVVVAELALPDMTGLGLCRLVREDPALCHTGFVMVSTHAAEIDRILAFEAGVDDFLAKPFFARELASRVGAVLRRSGLPRDLAAGPDSIPHGIVSFQLASGSVTVGRRRLDLTPREFHLLAALVRQAGRVLTRRQLIEGVWGSGSEQTDRVVDAHIKSIRRKLGEAKDCVETVRGVGYRFADLVAPVESRAEA